MKTSRSRSVLLVSTVVLSSALCARAQTNRWTNSVSGFWHDAVNWSAGAPISTQQLTFITNATTKTVTIDASTVLSNGINGCLTISNLTVGAPAGTLNTLQLTNAGVVTPLHILNNFTLSGSTLLITNAALQVDGATWRADGNTMMLGGSVVASNAFTAVGGTATGQMTVANGTVHVGQLRLGDTATGRGTLTVAGGSVLVFRSGSQSLFLGFSAGSSGTVWMTGGQLTTSNSTVIGNGGVGQMIVSNGSFNTPGPGGVVTIGENAGCVGTLTVAGAGASVNVSTNSSQGLLIGTGGTGTVWLIDGTIAVGTGVINISGGGSGQMIVSNGTASTRGSSTVASTAPGVGTLTVAGGQYYVGDQFFTIARAPGTTGTVWVTGSSSQIWVTNIVHTGYMIVGGSDIGGGGVGRMAVSNGYVQVNYGMVGAGAGSRGTLTIAGGTLLVSSNLTLGGDPIFPFTGSGTGTVAIASGRLNVTNATSDASLVVGREGRGVYTQDGGIVTVDQLLFTNAAQNAFTFNAGTLTVNNRTVFTNGIGVAMIVGDGASGNAATLQLPSGTHLIGDGLIAGNAAGTTGTVLVTGGALTAGPTVILGKYPCTAVGNVAVTSGGLSVTNAAGTALLEVRDGTVTVSGGLVFIDRLVITNACGHFIHTVPVNITTLVLAPDFDADNDGIPNAYELVHGLDPLDPSDADADPDHDGFTNLQEYLANTDPHDATSALRITAIAKEGTNDIRVTWTMGSGRTNALQATAGDENGNYSTNNFADIFTVTNTVGTITNYVDIGGATNFPARYYRVRLVP